MAKTKKQLEFLRRFAGFVVLAALVAASLFIPQAATAACATPNPNYGSATLQLSVSTAGNYRIWTRMNAPDTTNNSVLLEVDGGACFVVGDSNVTPNTWAWVNHQNGTLSSQITTTLSAGTHTVKVIGREPNVKIDRILAVADQNCVPSGLGENCMAASDTAKPTVAITEPADNATVGGNVTIKATASDNTSVSKVEFYVQNTLKATDNSAPYEYTWDASLLANGTYTIAAKAYDPTGNNATDTQAVTVKNGDTQAPSAPAGLKGTANAFNSIGLTWNASTDNVGVASYRVLRNNNVVATVAGTSYTDTGVVAGTTYSYNVVAVDSSNNVSGTSNTVQVNTPSTPTADAQAPSAPTDLSATAVSMWQINIAWKPSTDNVGVKEYDIYRNSDEDKTFRKVATTNNTSYGDSKGVYDNTTFTYYVIARDAAGNSSQPSAQAADRTPTLQERGTSTLRGTIQGRNGRPIAGAKVTVWVGDKRYQTTTNWRGRYILNNLPAGRYDVAIRANGYDRQTVSVRLSTGKTKWADVSLRRQ